VIATIEAAARTIAAARRVVVSTGAGISQESGIPTFRDAQEGIWARFDPQQLATEAGFRADPARVWAWYGYRRDRVLACEPNAGHRALVDLAQDFADLVVVTQNIDGLHQRAGSADVVELHGSILRYRCLDAGHPAPEPFAPDADGMPPPCDACGSPLRPDVVWFGEVLPQPAVERAWALAAECDVLLVVGTSGTVWPAAELPSVARRAGARVVEVNPEPGAATRAADLVLRGRAGDVLPRLVRDVRTLRAERHTPS
jgi:NAD-dependent deacetylase